MSENENAKKINKKGLIIGGIVVVLLLLIGVLTYFLMPTKPKKIFTTAIEKVYDTAKENSQVDDLLTGKFTLSTDLHSNKAEEEKVLDILNNLKISMDYGMDAKSKKMHIALDSDYKEKELLNASIDVLNNQAYVFLQDIYSKNLIVPIDGIDEMFNTLENVKEYEVILKHMKNALEKSFKEEYFSKESTTITIEDKKVKVTDNKLTLNEKNVKEIANVLSDELNNEEFIESFAKIANVTKEEVKDMLADLKNEEVDLEDGTLYVSIYTKGLQNTFVGITFKDESDEISIYKNSKTNYSYEIKIDNKNYKGEAEVKTEKKDIYMKVSFDIEGISGFVTFDFKENNATLPDVDTTNAISIEDLSENEASEILNNLQQKEGIIELIQAFSNLNAISLDF